MFGFSYSTSKVSDCLRKEKGKGIHKLRRFNQAGSDLITQACLSLSLTHTRTHTHNFLSEKREEMTEEITDMLCYEAHEAVFNIGKFI
jgi:hypothetical protein